MEIIADILHNRNPYAHFYRTMAEVERRERESAAAQNLPAPVVSMHMRTGPDRRRYNDPHFHEVAAVFTSADGAADAPRDIVVYPYSNRLKTIKYLSHNSDPMSYPLFYPSGEPGWSINLSHVAEHDTEHRNMVTLLQYYTYRWADRGRFNALHYGGMLTQQKMVDDFVKVETNRMDYIKKEQSRLRVETCQGLYDHLYNNNSNINNNPTNSNSNFPHSPTRGDLSVAVSSSPQLHHQSNNMIDPPDSPLLSIQFDFDADLGAVQPGHDAGTPVILPSSFMGSPRNMSEAYHDAMTVVRTLGSPDLFITFTCNENWPEIRDNLEPGYTPSDRPDLIASVFQMYHTELMKDLAESHVLGRCISKINVIELQKRGKPHSHILIHLDDADKIRCAADIDSIVSAEIPDPNLFPELYQVVSSCMMHGPCGGTFNITEGVCMRDGECTKAFPKPYAPHTVFADNGYPVYRRLDDGRAVTKNGKHHTNQWVVPYNPCRCHINVEICVSIKSIKYLFKYVYKGHDCACMEFQRDAIKMYLDSRYICAPEAAHRLLEFKMRHSTFSVVRLPVHLQDMQSVFYKPGEEQVGGPSNSPSK